ncbi:MFS maltose permease [Colletotrichum kahawae]|uniref:MFS maltose permease n=1 Tax=Colletotrichum kahawae TaxID=34407 RepID=A0AAE0D772_COLKA|nr:MFS maltose permease [Colletotrichum kahawae]
MWGVRQLFEQKVPARKGRTEEAENSLRRLVSAPITVIDPKDSLATIVRTIEAERLMSIQGSYLDCFRGDSLRRTEIAMGYLTGNAGLAFVGTSSWALMTKFGWRTMYLGGLIAMFPVMSLVGFLDLATNTPSGDNVRWAQCAMLLVWFFIYGASIGPVPYGIAANVGATSIRVKTISLGRNTYYFLSIINTIASPYLLNPQEGNLKGKAAFPAVAFTLMLIVWAFFRLPEIKGMSPEVLDQLFKQKVPSRKFLQESKKYQ